MKPSIVDSQYIIYCLRIEPVTGSIIYLTSYPRDLLIGSNTYKTDSGYEFSGLQSESTFSPATLDLGGILDVAGIDRDALASGAYDNAKCYLFATTWNAPVEDEEPLAKGIFGKSQIIDDRYTVQIMTLLDTLNQSVGETCSPLCQKEFGSQTFAGCKIDLADYTVTGTITSVTSNSVFRDSARIEAVDYFTVGTFEFTSGNNVGLKAQDVKAYAANGTFTLFEPFFYDVQVGDTYTAIGGCRKREEDCVAKDNINNFGGVSFVPVKTVFARGGIDK